MSLSGCVVPFPQKSAWSVTGLLEGALSTQRLAGILRITDGSLDLLTDPGRDGTLATYNPVMVGRGDTSQEIRQRLVGYVLMIAAAATIDPGSLGKIVVEHVGGPDQVDLAALRATIEAARWTTFGRSWLLEADCRHEAVEIALRERASQVGVILSTLHKAAVRGETDLRGLSGLPTYASDDRVRAAEADTPDGQKLPVYVSPGMRFQLSDDQVRELLMGVNLYGDKALAIRELYQNALDACRYRQARQQLLDHNRRKGEPKFPGTTWSGEIRFTQGTDERGHAYLECTDNGVGMGDYELRSVFSRPAPGSPTCRSSSRSRRTGGRRASSSSRTAASASECSATSCSPTRSRSERAASTPTAASGIR